MAKNGERIATEWALRWYMREMIAILWLSVALAGGIGGRGSAEDLIFTDTFQTSEGITARTSLGTGGSSNRGLLGRGIGAQVGDNEAQRIQERKHEATASVRLVTKDGDVIWSTTQESYGGKFKGAAADVAEKVAKRLSEDFGKAKEAPGPASAGR